MNKISLTKKEVSYLLGLVNEDLDGLMKEGGYGMYGTADEFDFLDRLSDKLSAITELDKRYQEVSK